MSKEKDINRIDNKEAGIGINNKEILENIYQGLKDASLDVAKTKCIVKIKDEATDLVLLLEDDSILHLKFEINNKQADIISLYVDDLKLYKKYLKPVKTIVIYSSNIANENVNTQVRIGPNAYYKVETIFMDRFNENIIFKDLKKVHLENE